MLHASQRASGSPHKIGERQIVLFGRRWATNLLAAPNRLERSSQFIDKLGERETRYGSGQSQ